jgi:isoleucyl-tRNA synthetase
MYLAEYVTLETGTGIVHSSPAYGVDDFATCKKYGIPMKKSLIRSWEMVSMSTLPLFGGLNIWKAQPEIVKTIEAAGAPFYTTQFPAFLPALLAAQNADGISCDFAVVC